MKSCWIIVLLSFAQLSFAQSGHSISGSITDSKGEAINNAEVLLSPTNGFVISNKKGLFRFINLVDGKYTLTIYSDEHTVNYTTLELKGRDTTISISLEDEIINLEVVEINGDKRKHDGHEFLKDVDGTAVYAAKKTESINLDKIVANKSTNNPRQIYNHIAGLNIWESDAYGLQLGIGGRGLNPNRTTNFNTRQNGFDMSADNLGYPDAYYSPPAELLQKIKIVRGAASLQYGTQFGGMLNFELKKGNDSSKVSAVLRNTIGAFGFYNTSSLVGGKINKTNYLSFFQYKRGNGWRENSEFDQYTGHINIQHEVSDKLEIGIEYTFMNYLAHQAGGLTDDQFYDDPRKSYRNRNWFEVNWHMPAIHLDYQFSNHTYMNSRTFGLIAERNAVGNLGVISRPDIESENRNLILGRYKNIGNETRLIHKYKLGKQLHGDLLIGTRYFKGNTRSTQGEANNLQSASFKFIDNEPLASDYKNPSENIAIFTENIFRITDKLSLVPGLRYEYIKTTSDGFYFDPSYDLAGNIIFDAGGEENIKRTRNLFLMGLGISYHLSEKTELYGNTSQNYRAIGFSDLRIQNDNQIIDPDMGDESGFSTDIGLRRADHIFKFDISAFYVRYFDRIGNLPVVQNRVILQQRTNIDDANIYGVESLIEVDVLKLKNDSSDHTLSIFANTSFIQATYSGSKNNAVAGKRVEFVPAVNLKTGLKYAHNNLKVSWQVAYLGEQFSDPTNAIELPPGYTSGLIPSYTVMDLSISYKYKRYRVETGINNLLDQRYFTRRATGYPGPGIIPSDGRSFYFTLEVRL